LTFNNRPAVGAALGSVSQTAPATTYNVSLPAATIQASTGQMLSLAIDSTGGDAFYIGSKESATPPRLVVTTQ
jgi:hypothetical protein